MPLIVALVATSLAQTSAKPHVMTHGCQGRWSLDQHMNSTTAQAALPVATYAWDQRAVMRWHTANMECIDKLSTVS